MNNAKYTSLSNIPLLPICHYITAFSIFLANIDSMTINNKNQPLPDTNLFEYLKYTNKSEAKIQFLRKIQSKFIKANKEENMDMKSMNETYHYIINAMFYHLENFTRYPSGFRNATFSVFRDFVQQRILDKRINFCLIHFTRNGKKNHKTKSSI